MDRKIGLIAARDYLLKRKPKNHAEIFDLYNKSNKELNKRSTDKILKIYKNITEKKHV
jgi:hypothetical protein